MASAKRCKQFSENNNRTQDIAPRFKRQKSFNSNKPPAMESSNQNQNISAFPRFKKSWGESQPMNSGNQQLKGTSYPREGRKIVKKLSVQKAQTNAERNGLKSSFVLSPMENKLFNLVRNDESDNQDCFGLDQTYSNCDAQVPSVERFVNCPQTAAWVETAQQLEGAPSVRSTDSPPSSNYDPDTRTIEMLRELERVADQTDFGSEENNNDKNSLVSHHLRMLMCAVDRYTQGVDEDVTDSCEEESLPSEEPQRIPSPVINPIKQDYYRNDQSPPMSPFGKNDGFMTSTPVPQLVQTVPDNRPHMLTTWNLWSSPGFNGLDVYGFHEVPASPGVSYHAVNPNNCMYFGDHVGYHMQQMPFSR